MNYRNILHIDDDEDDLELFALAIEKVAASAICTSVNSALAALKQLTSNLLQPDLIFLDLNMPLMSGQQFLSALKKDAALSHIPVVILSTSANNATIRTLKQTGAKDFITKPASFDALVSLVKPFVAG